MDQHRTRQNGLPTTFVSIVSNVRLSHPKFLGSRRKLTQRPVRLFRASLGDDIDRALSVKFAGEDISRVSSSFRAVRTGQILEHNPGTSKHQRAHSFVEGLESKPWHDPDSFEWASKLTDNWREIADELRSAIALPDLERQGNNIWAPPVVDEARSYGPDWRTLVLQDRQWDEVNAKIFPSAVRLLQAAGVPSVESFFARQGKGGTGIALHTDDCNFILTGHLLLDVPPENESCWIEVAGERKYYDEPGKMLIFDTSYYHRTRNDSNTRDRTVLLIRFWHPGLSLVEQQALGFLFEAISNPSLATAVLENHQQEKVSKRKRGGRGFGRK